MLRKMLDDSSLSATQLGVGLTIVQCLVAIPVVLAVRAPPRQERAVVVARDSSSTATTAASSGTLLGQVTSGGALPETVANLFMYGPAAFIAYWKAGFLQNNASVTTTTTTAAATATSTSKVPMLLLAHFGKKAMEKILLKGAQSTGSAGVPEEEIPVLAIVQTSLFCGVGTYLIAAPAFPVPAGIDVAQIVFWLGQLGNSFHAYLLEHYKAKVVGTNNSRGIPETGGLFQLNVAAPQLLFEIVAWLGIATSARSVSGYVQAGLTAVVLGYQAKRLNDAAAEAGTNSLSRSADGGAANTSKKRWNLIPYIY